MSDEFKNIPENENDTVNTQDSGAVQPEQASQPEVDAKPVTAEPVMEEKQDEQPAQSSQSEEHKTVFDAQQNNQYNYNPYATQNFDNSGFRGNNFQQVPPQPHSSKKGLRIFCLLLAIVVFASLACGVGYMAGKNFDLTGGNTGNDVTDKSVLTPDDIKLIDGKIPSTDTIKPGEDGKYTAQQVAKLVSPSVVSITVYSDDSTGTSVASGIILDSNGYILSNDHIYSEIPNAKFVVTLSDGRSFKAVFVAGDSKSDLCVIKMNDATNITPASFGDSSKIASGEDVIAIGSPYGFSNTVTKGIVSTPSRRISFSSSDSATYSMKVIQTDTAINYGSSGGALVNMYGQIVGISSSKIVLESYEGMCFAIPSNTAKSVAADLVKNKKVVGRARLGITYNEINSATAVANNIPTGLRLQEIGIESSLKNSGLQKGDIITEIDGVAITTADAALDIIESKKAGDTISIKAYVASSSSYKTVNVKLLEDASVSSYKTKIETTTSFNPFNQK